MRRRWAVKWAAGKAAEAEAVEVGAAELSVLEIEGHSVCMRAPHLKGSLSYAGKTGHLQYILKSSSFVLLLT